MAGTSSRKQLLRASAQVTEMAVLVVAGVLAGGWLDDRLGTGPLFLFLLALAAFAGGTYRLIRSVDGPGSRNDQTPS